MMINYLATCMFGLESVVSFEVSSLGFTNVHADNGKVYFSGNINDVAKANIFIRSAERVLICLAEFEAQSFEELFQGVRMIDWHDFIGVNDKFPVKGYSLDSVLHSVPDCQAIIKKAVVEKLKTIYKVNWFEETGSIYQIQFAIRKNKVTILLDTTGEPLHKRGYREISSAAPIKETIAAGLIDIARYKGKTSFYDPMCGSGTFVIEAAMRVMNIAPGLKRHFISEQWKHISQITWIEQRDNASSQIIKIDKNIYGSDIDSKVIDIARLNAKKAGVSEAVHFECKGIESFDISEPSLIITNPPYGERMLDVNTARRLYQTMGIVLPALNRQCYIISPDEDFEIYFGIKANKKRKIYNGMIKCFFYQYYK